MNSRLKAIRKELKLTQNEFGEKIGITGATVSDIERGKLALTDRNISLICEKLLVNEEWIRHGIGDMFRPELPVDENTVLLANLDLDNNPKTKAFLEIYEQLDEKSKSVLLDLARSLLENSEQKK